MSGPPLSRRRSLGLIAASLAFSAAGCARSDDRAILKVGSQRGGTKSLMLSSGALAGAGYTVEWSDFPAAQNLLEAIGSGAIDVGLAGDAPFQFAFQSGSPIKAISAQIVIPRPREAVALIVPPHSAAHTVADLKGKRIATTRGSIGHYLALRALDDMTLPFDAVQFIFLTPGDAKAAFSSGSVDAWSTWVPYLNAAIKEGARVLADGYKLIHGYGFEIVNDQAIAGKAGLLADFTRREAHALHWAATHKADYARVLAGETGLPIDVAYVMVEKTLRTVIPIDANVIADQRLVLETFRRAGAITGARPLDQAFQRAT